MIKESVFLKAVMGNTSCKKPLQITVGWGKNVNAYSAYVKRAFQTQIEFLVSTVLRQEAAKKSWTCSVCFVLPVCTELPALSPRYVWFGPEQRWGVHRRLMGLFYYTVPAQFDSTWCGPTQIYTGDRTWCGYGTWYHLHRGSKRAELVFNMWRRRVPASDLSLHREGRPDLRHSSWSAFWPQEWFSSLIHAKHNTQWSINEAQTCFLWLECLQSENVYCGAGGRDRGAWLCPAPSLFPRSVCQKCQYIRWNVRE